MAGCASGPPTTQSTDRSHPFDSLYSRPPRDWCISRQLWWGHRIPAYFAQKKGEKLDRNDQVGRSVGRCGKGGRRVRCIIR